MNIKKIAVLGAGVMGAQIAAHCANAGFDTYLYDLVAEDKDKNALINKAIGHLLAMTPKPLATTYVKSFIHAKNYTDDLSFLGECDLIIEAIAERLDLKNALFKQISPYLHDKSIVVSNSSGLSMEALSEAFPMHLRSRFCGVHFFNPPRYMHLAELIPTQSTSSLLLDDLESWLTRFLGKGVIRAKDTPNFIANRIGVFSLLAVLHHAQRFGLAIDEVDAITGVLLNRPKSATYRTLDVVGLDTMQHVVSTMQKTLPDDPWHSFFTLPAWMSALIQKGHLGQKTGAGLYRKVGKNIEVYDPKLDAYRSTAGSASAALQEILKQPDAHRMQALFDSEDIQAQFLSAYFTDLFHYSAYHLHAIAHSAEDVDSAMRWGFGWKEGPFELWEKSGVQALLKLIQSKVRDLNLNASMPAWINEINTFYPNQKQERPLVYARQYILKNPIIYENAGVEVRAEEGVAVVSLKTKSGAINEAVLEGLQEALFLAESHYAGLVLYQKNPETFSAGADLKMVSECLLANEKDRLRNLIAQFQKTMLLFRYSSVPVVAALRGRALGGGCELLMHCDRVVCALESYPGLVEVGVGLIPAGGGCKEWARRTSDLHKDEHFRVLQHAFEQTAMGIVATSALDAIERGYLRSSDIVLMHTEEVLYGALKCVRSLVELNYTPPRATLFKAAGIEFKARCQAKLVNLMEGNFMLPHDYVIAMEMLHVISGGAVHYGELISESYLMNLELDAFMRLVETPQTQARIKHWLETGQSLRN